MKQQPTYLTRKDVANLLECNTLQVQRNEVNWGIRKARRDLNKRIIRYLASVVIAELLARRLIEPDTPE